jgi:hypothetical protein
MNRKTKKILNRKNRAYEKHLFKNNLECTPKRQKMLGKFASYEYEYYWS